ncbi:MAG: ABC transporter ATP-binding protein [Firmicutes bacterium]|nr:ABC transporter ATP-binding protein [Bacillota bacterium]
MSANLLSVRNLTIEYGSGRKRQRAVDNVSFEIQRGETLALVGESGSGKTTIGRAIVRLVKVKSGKILYRGSRINGRIGRKRARELTKKIQMIFQDPMSSLNERAKVEYIVSEGMLNIRNYRSDSERLFKVHQALSEVGLLPEFADRFPHEFSGGQRQRIGIARALVMEPELIIADEPISALDVSIRAQVLNLLDRLKRERNLTYLFIAHDLAVVRQIADRVAVIHQGQLVELAPTEVLFRSPLHPYTRALLSAIPLPDPRRERKRQLLTYKPVEDRRDRKPPKWVEVTPGHFILATARQLREFRPK